MPLIFPCSIAKKKKKKMGFWKQGRAGGSGPSWDGGMGRGTAPLGVEPGAVMGGGGFPPPWGSQSRWADPSKGRREE